MFARRVATPSINEQDGKCFGIKFAMDRMRKWPKQ
jgi:hypothetical protein